jgi:hypothetical protein
MSADKNGNPYIATYWRETSTGIPQYYIVYTQNGQWKSESLNTRKTDFTLSGMGTKLIPIGRPQILLGNGRSFPGIAIIFRDKERGNKISVAIKKKRNARWQVYDLSTYSTGSWEPTYDPQLWRQRHLAHLFVQQVDQVDNEGLSNAPPQMIRVLEWKPGF